jgi:hypothetical protein
MKSSYLIRILLLASTGLAGLLPATASACSVCMGGANTKTAGAINGAIFLMLGFVALMLGGLGAFIYQLVKRANAPLPPHAEISASTPAEDDSKVL